MTATTSTGQQSETVQALYRLILENPFDDLPRLIYADEIEESEPERSEFIRFQIANPKHTASYSYPYPQFGTTDETTKGVKLTILRRGFIDEIHCTIDEWIGVLCPNDRDQDGVCYRKCKTCGGTGRVNGVARDLCERLPITKLIVTDLLAVETANDSKELAMAEASHAGLNYGRRLAGLPPI